MSLPDYKWLEFLSRDSSYLIERPVLSYSEALDFQSTSLLLQESLFKSLSGLLDTSVSLR